MRKTFVGTAGLALAATSVLFSSPSASAASFYTYGNASSGKCMAVPNNSGANGTELVQWTCTGNSDQVWTPVAVPGGDGNRIKLVNFNSDKCLAIGGSSTEAGAKAIQWECTGNDDQIWIRDSALRLRNLNSDLCLAVPNSSQANGTKLIQWTCTLGLDQQWPRTEVTVGA
ncbi:RICIN domain-containing protein [Streptomyces sp. NPDC060006]|uniref:RICIN domain-containing protein n=1 Tax=unclassified Streptomyces TaxID=2593676 RepID=UPI0036C3877B